MTNKQPDALRLAELLELAPEDGIEPQTAEDAAAELLRQHDRIAELEAQLESIGAGGVSGPLMGCVSLAASAGSEPVAEVMFADGKKYIQYTMPKELLPVGTKLYTHPSPQEGMVGGWISVDERLPQPFKEVVVSPRPDDYCCEAFCDMAGNWKWAEYEHNFGVHHRECHVEYWLMLPEVPAPPTTSAGSGKGE